MLDSYSAASSPFSRTLEKYYDQGRDVLDICAAILSDEEAVRVTLARSITSFVNSRLPPNPYSNH